MGGHQRIWTPDPSSEGKNFSDTLYIYDAGDFIGYLTVKQQSKRWSGFSLVSRERKDSRIIETLEPSHEFSVPLHFFSIESYPAKIESSTLWIPGWKIQLQGQQKPQLHESEGQSDLQQQPIQHHPLPLPQRQNLQRQPQHQHRPQKTLQPQSYPQSSPRHRQSSSLRPVKSSSEKQAQSQDFSQNKSNNVPTLKASPSSNQVSHEKQKRSTPKKSEEQPKQSLQDDHTVPLSQWYPLSQVSSVPLSPSTHPPLTLQPNPSSPNQTSSKRSSTSQRVQHQRGGRGRRQPLSQQSSHE